MEYLGEDTHKQTKEKLIALGYSIEINIVERYSIEIFVYKHTEITKEKVAGIHGFFYNYPHNLKSKIDSFHIKSLGVYAGYRKQGIATYLVKETINYAEQERIRHITVNPCATTMVISHDNLEAFYKKFQFTSRRIFTTKEDALEFYSVPD